MKATDSKGNVREEPISITFEPRSGAHISVVEAFARVCLSDICGRWTEEPFAATLESGPGQATIEFQFEMQNDTVEDLYLSWDSASSGTYGDIPMEVSLKEQAGIATSLILVVMLGISALLFAWYRNSE